jgi:hypothetical protein
LGNILISPRWLSKRGIYRIPRNRRATSLADSLISLILKRETRENTRMARTIAKRNQTKSFDHTARQMGIAEKTARIDSNRLPGKAI